MAPGACGTGAPGEETSCPAHGAVQERPHQLTLTCHNARDAAAVVHHWLGLGTGGGPDITDEGACVVYVHHQLPESPRLGA